MKPIHVACSPLTGTIYAGSVLKDGRTWGTQKRDVTLEALVAVAEHTLISAGAKREAINTVSAGGVPRYRITVERLDT